MTKWSKEKLAARRKKKEEEKILRLAKNTIESSLEETEDKDIPIPTRFYKIGDRVKYGNWNWSAVLEIFDGGKYYKLVSETRNTNRNVPDYSELKIHYEPWFRFVSYKSPEEIQAMKTYIEDDDIIFNYSSRDVYSLISMYFQKYGIDLEPEYQRGNVWTEEQKVALIDSIFKNVDIGKFTIIKRPWGPDGNKPITPKLYEMLDGKQRLTALVDFYLNRFPYKGKYYDDLLPLDKHHFKFYKISEAETENLTREQKLRYFLKLNTSGTPICPAHMARVKDMHDSLLDDKKVRPRI